MSMVKLIYGSSFDSTVDVGMRLVHDAQGLIKAAGTVFGMDYDQLKPEKGHVGIHLTALGEYERFGLNRNYDGMPKVSCVRDHHTFVKNGAIFRHHRNKDRAKSLGIIKASAYNPEMGRIELFIHVDPEKAPDELARLEKEGEVPFSMATRVPFDVCTICGTKRKNSEDPAECDHIKYELGKMAEDGTVVGMLNTENNFFDISFVGRPADRIAWNLKVAAGEIVDSVKLAQAEGLWVPDHIAIESAAGLRKLAHLRDIAAAQDQYHAWFTKSASVVSPVEQYRFELRKAASHLPDSTILKLRTLEPKVAFAALADAGVVMDPPSFFKYAMGLDYGAIAQWAALAIAAVPAAISSLVKSGECQKVCNDATFDVLVDSYTQRAVPLSLRGELDQYSCCGQTCEDRILVATMQDGAPKFAVDRFSETCLNVPETVALAEKYAAYQIAAVDAIVESHKGRDTDQDSVRAIAAAQNLVV